MGGLTNIEWENGLAEISLIIDPSYRGGGRGRMAVQLLLDQAFCRLRLETVFGEVYTINPALDFWAKVARHYTADCTTLPRRKFWNGNLYSSMYFSITREGWADAERVQTA